MPGGKTPGAKVTDIEETRDPIETDDIDQALDVGSRWINTSTKAVYYCVDNTAGAAVWVLISGQPSTSGSRPDTFSLFDPGVYTKKDTIDTEVVYYTRVFLAASTVIIEGETFIVTGSSGKNVRIGLYDQATPSSRTGTPNNKLRQTASLSTNGVNNAYLSAAWDTSPYVVQETGFYWIAFVVDDSPDILVTPEEYEEGFAPYREQSTTGDALPASASGLSQNKSALAYAGVVRPI